MLADTNQQWLNVFCLFTCEISLISRRICKAFKLFILSLREALTGLFRHSDMELQIIGSHAESNAAQRKQLDSSLDSIAAFTLISNCPLNLLVSSIVTTLKAYTRMVFKHRYNHILFGMHRLYLKSFQSSVQSPYILSRLCERWKCEKLLINYQVDLAIFCRLTLFLIDHIRRTLMGTSTKVIIFLYFSVRHHSRD